MGTMVVTFWVTFAVILVARFSKNSRRAYLSTALPLFALSLVSPLTAASTAISTRLILAAVHLIVGAIIIPVAARRLSSWTAALILVPGILAVRRWNAAW